MKEVTKIESAKKMEDIIIAVVFVGLGILELYLTYRYSQDIKKLKYQPATAPLAMWSGVFIGAVFIIVPIINLFGDLSNMGSTGRIISIIGSILFWIAAIASWLRAEKMRKQKNKPANSSWQLIATYVIMAAALISGVCTII
ncbi:hypothetical protein [uncultured Lactobacillus sp.]|uniref:hypothetical protein n=1 Tax=uncultured Lactobacillus sp. TaxID=153152 RepID=UPI0028038F21|nr:hypothetical protein [uncultured Lactobacillus sp.]